MKLVAYADWPESAIMMDCRHGEYTEIPDAMICLKKGGCTCLLNGRIEPEDLIPKDGTLYEVTEEQEKERLLRELERYRDKTD